MDQDQTFATFMSRLRAGDEEATAEVFRRFVRRLIALASRQFDSWLRPMADVEGVVQSVYKSFFLRCEQGRFDFDDWEALWGMLALITLRKCANRLAFIRAGCRDAGREVSLEAADELGNYDWVAIDRELTPLEAAMLTETIEQLLRGCEGPERAIIELILQGCSAPEIAARLGRSERTVWRVRQHLRDRLQRLQAQGGHIP